MDHVFETMVDFLIQSGNAHELVAEKGFADESQLNVELLASIEEALDKSRVAVLCHLDLTHVNSLITSKKTVQDAIKLVGCFQTMSVCRKG